MLAYLISGLILLGGVGVVISAKPVYSVLFLIFSFLNSAVLYILLGAEFVALSTIIIYVGAVSVLLLFVVMTLTNSAEKSVLAKLITYRYWIGGIVGIFAVELIVSLYSSKLTVELSHQPIALKDIGKVLYVKYALLLEGCAVLLLVAMVSAVIVTFQSRGVKNIKRQNPADQINRKPDEILRMVPIKNREGL